MPRRPLRFISREKECELINKLLTIVDNRRYDPKDTALLMVSPDYSATVAMHLCHAWSRDGDILRPIAIDVTFPDEHPDAFITRLKSQKDDICRYEKLVLVEAGIIRGGNWTWILDVLINDFGYNRSDITLIALLENIHSKVKSDYVAEYYNDDDEDLTFYYERFNKHWPIK
jgi:hypothetical protein